MTSAIPTALRRLVLLGAPLSLGLLNLTHPGPDPANPTAMMLQSLLAQNQVDWMITLHFIQTILVGFMGLAIWWWRTVFTVRPPRSAGSACGPL